MFMPHTRTREELHQAYEKKLRKRDHLIKEVRYLQDRVAMYDKCSAELRRAVRTHRLCTRGGMLERALGDPELLTDVQVDALIRMAFAHEDVQAQLQAWLNEVYEHPEAVNL